MRGGGITLAIVTAAGLAGAGCSAVLGVDADRSWHPTQAATQEATRARTQAATRAATQATTLRKPNSWRGGA